MAPFFGILFILISAMARGADDCTTVKDLSTGLPPVHNQADLGWCYAFTLSDLMGQKLQQDGKLKRGETISPLNVAAMYYMWNGKNPTREKYTGGVVSYGIDRVNEMAAAGQKLCKESDLSSKDGSENEVFKKSSAAAGRLFQEALKKPIPKEETKRAQGRSACVLKSGNLKTMQNLTDNMDAVGKAVWQKELKDRCQIDPPQFGQELEWASDRDIEHRKSGRITEDKDADKRLEKKLDEALGKGKMAGISYDPRFMLQKSGEGLHVSSVVARERGRDGQCYYKIRNSWGESCEPYNEQVKKGCRQGNLWVKSSDLIRNTVSVTYIP